MTEIPYFLMKNLERVSIAKRRIMAYPYYTYEQKNAWFDALDGMLDCEKQAYINAKEALDAAFKEWIEKEKRKVGIMTTMRAKMKVNSVKLIDNGEILEMQPVTNGTVEDNTYSKYTPSGNLTLTISNPDLYGKFKPGHKYYVDFTVAEASGV